MSRNLLFTGKMEIERAFNWDKNGEYQPNLNDCFLLTTEGAKALAVSYTRKNEEGEFEEELFVPRVGDKIYGEFRDKGSNSAMVHRVLPIVVFDFEYKVEADNLVRTLEMRDKKYTRVDDHTVEFSLDIISNPSMERDNLVALTLKGCLELEAHISNIDIELTMDEAREYTIDKLPRDYYKTVKFVHVKSGKELFRTKMLIMLEQFYCQPQHSPRFKSKLGKVSLTYQQALDGLDAYLPDGSNFMRNNLDLIEMRKCIEMLSLEIIDNNEVFREMEPIDYSFNTKDDIIPNLDNESLNL